MVTCFLVVDPNDPVRGVDEETLGASCEFYAFYSSHSAKTERRLNLEVRTRQNEHAAATVAGEDQCPASVERCHDVDVAFLVQRYDFMPFINLQ